ncbi:MAG: glycosyltransferase family 4 protein [Bacteroidales bacterium]|nr:glycosyltransferase family 4 protein [Bacteroidales bacterium]
MKILHLNTYDIEGGASRGAYWLHKALLKTGVSSNMLVSKKTSDDDTVLTQTSKLQKGIALLSPAIDSIPLKGYKNRRQLIFSPSWAPNLIGREVRLIDPDIVHLHWVCGGFLNPGTYLKFRKPIVWTLRDMWGFTGGCHITEGCERYFKACGKCPQLGSKKENDLSRWVWKRKLGAWEQLDMTIICISHWLADCARKSSLFRNKRIEVIHNAVNEETFKPLPKNLAREIFNLRQDKKIILFGGINAVKTSYKGFNFLIQALNKLKLNGFGNNHELVVFGSTRPADAPDAGLRAHYLGRFYDDISLALLYSAADVTVVPSIQEGLGKVAIESMACGTPVVSFDSSGLKDSVEHQRNGYRAKCFDSEDLANGIVWTLRDDQRWKALSRRAREKVEQEFTLDMHAKNYLKLYEDILMAKS